MDSKPIFCPSSSGFSSIKWKTDHWIGKDGGSLLKIEMYTHVKCQCMCIRVDLQCFDCAPSAWSNPGPTILWEKNWVVHECVCTLPFFHSLGFPYINYIHPPVLCLHSFLSLMQFASPQSPFAFKNNELSKQLYKKISACYNSNAVPVAGVSFRKVICYGNAGVSCAHHVPALLPSVSSIFFNTHTSVSLGDLNNKASRTGQARRHLLQRIAEWARMCLVPYLRIHLRHFQRWHTVVSFSKDSQEILISCHS